jgi:hypothetical protein
MVTLLIPIHATRSSVPQRKDSVPKAPWSSYTEIIIPSYVNMLILMSLCCNRISYEYNMHRFLVPIRVMETMRLCKQRKQILQQRMQCPVRLRCNKNHSLPANLYSIDVFLETGENIHVHYFICILVAELKCMHAEIRQRKAIQEFNSN